MKILTAKDFHEINASMLPPPPMVTFNYQETKMIDRVATKMWNDYVERAINAINSPKWQTKTTKNS
jgi:hypothetical protein